MVIHAEDLFSSNKAGYQGWDQRGGEMVVVLTDRAGGEHEYAGDAIDRLIGHLAAHDGTEEIAQQIMEDMPHF